MPPALAAGDQGVAEAAHVSGGFPDTGVHDNGSVQADHIFAAANHVLPPGVLHVALQFNAERAVIPEPVDTAIDLRPLEDEPTPLAQGRQRVQR